MSTDEAVQEIAMPPEVDDAIADEIVQLLRENPHAEVHADDGGWCTETALLEVHRDLDVPLELRPYTVSLPWLSPAARNVAMARLTRRDPFEPIKPSVLIMATPQELISFADARTEREIENKRKAGELVRVPPDYRRTNSTTEESE